MDYVVSILNQMFSNIVFQTVLSGVLVFVIGQSMYQLLIEKYFGYRRVVEKVDNRLRFYFKIIENPGNDAHPIERLQFCSQELLQLSCDLESCRRQLIFKSENIDKNVYQASNLLVDLHFGVFGKNISDSDKNLDNLKKIRNLLSI